MMNDDLNELFNSARQQQPNLTDDDFTNKVVSNLLLDRTAKRRLWFDFYGVVAGVIAVLMTFGSSLNVLQFFQTVYVNILAASLDVSPISGTITPFYWVVASAGLGLAYTYIWWRSEA